MAYIITNQHSDILYRGEDSSFDFSDEETPPWALCAELLFLLSRCQHGGSLVQQGGVKLPSLAMIKAA